ncbi:putative amidohydrolase [Paenibacillus shirakamiensis]|uniref:Amidohydrolase n=1 Tax=Paenibacillus shirakamiensis TaxID=1265935 RepID=A0ABS4JEU9_9BACL|nr:carbon-nitrogen family hydrolase [Paenibacillus shirakamiensis]MBP1999600.1 putative amidohydrolase [Paenibacillus shirakamiensis]
MTAKPTLNITMIQSDIMLGEPDANRVRVKTQMEQAMDMDIKPDVIVLPEMWNTGYALDQIQDLADAEGALSKTWLAQFAAEHRVHIIGGSVAQKTDGLVRNTMYTFNRDGELTAEYSKIHLFRLMEEEKHLTSGDEIVTFPIEGAMGGASICYDIRFPELSRTLALQGAKVLFVPAEWPHPRLHHWRTLLTARAIENQMYVVACNRVGSSGKDTFFGHSLIIDPWGEIIAEGGESEELVSGQIDLNLVDEVRTKIPVFEDRRPYLYQLDRKDI